jgi:hypothetical protein
VKIIIDLDPKLQRKLEVVAHNRGSSVSDVTAEILSKILNREASSTSGDGIPSPALVDAAKKAAAAQPTGDVLIEKLSVLLGPIIARLRMMDADGTQRRALISEMQTLPKSDAVTRVVGLIQASIG